MTDPLARAVEATGSAHFDAEAKRATGKRVLLVEGHDDRSLIEAVLGAHTTTWATSIAVIACGGRNKVRRALERQRLPYGTHVSSPLHGLVDRDTWTNAELAEVTTAIPSLHITEGWCAENYFFSHGVWGQLVSSSDDREHVQAALNAARPQWVAAGVWWTLTQRHNEVLSLFRSNSTGYGRPLAGVNLLDPTEVTTHLIRLDEIYTASAPCKIEEEFKAHLRHAQGLSAAEQWIHHVHGKEAFKQVLVPALNAQLGQRSARHWRVTLGPKLLAQPLFSDLCVALGL